jgi:hypothetical protein
MTWLAESFHFPHSFHFLYVTPLDAEKDATEEVSELVEGDTEDVVNAHEASTADAGENLFYTFYTEFINVAQRSSTNEGSENSLL